MQQGVCRRQCCGHWAATDYRRAPAPALWMSVQGNQVPRAQLMQDRHCKSASRLFQSDALRAPFSGTAATHQDARSPRNLWSFVMTMQKSIGIVAVAVAALVASPLAAQQAADSKGEGFYAGVNAGGLWQSTSASIGENNTGGGFSGNGSG